MKKTVFIIHPHSNFIFNVTSLYLVKCLIDDQFNIVIFTNCDKSENYYKSYSNVQIRPLPLFYPRPPRRPLLFFKKTLQPWLAARKEFAKYNNPEIIVIDPEGFYTASRIFPQFVKKFNYISFEMFFLDELKDELMIKIHHRAIAQIKKGIKSLIIPDHYRLALFLKEHKNHKIGRTFCIPVSPSRFYLPTDKDSAALDFETKLNHGERSVIYSGSLYDWSGIKELIKEIAKESNPKFRLFIHSQSISDGLRADLESFISRHAPQMSITILGMQLDYAPYLAFIKKFDIGLATYIPFTSDSPYDGKNFAEIGYSSSKFSTLMMLGIPTIATTNNSFNDIKKTHDFGYVVNDFTEINDALSYIDTHFEENQKGALKVYNELLDPTDKVRSFIDFLNSEVNASR